MAQAVFDDGPMEEYLREAGEVPELMPGGSTVFTECGNPTFAVDGSQGNGYVAKVAVVIQSAVSKLANRTPRFVERFKYDIISSSLLCDTLSPANALRNPTSPTFPGNISSRNSSIANDAATDLPALAADSVPPGDYWMSSVALVVVALCIGGGYYVVACLAAGAALLTTRLENMDLGNDRKPTLNALRDLIHASNVWDSVIQECFNILEKDEQYGFSGLKDPVTPSSSLRVAVNTTIHTTQSQCDNVRQLFAALTTPSELSQLSEMYAPPSPEGKSPTEKRPLSLPLASPGPSPSKDDRLSPTNRRDKRSTWNGTYSSLASAGSPTPQFLRRREKRRSDLFSLLSASTTPASSFSEPVTPATGSLFGVQEEHDEKDMFDDSLDLSFDSDDSFGVAALDMQRNRQHAGYATVGARPMSSFYGSSKFTSIQPPRHPLSLSALQNSLQSALASKRYSCSHLLALRFDEDDEEGYWEDVRSVMSLLTSAFADAAARLTDSLEEAERLRIKFENPSPESMPSHSRSTSLTGQQSRRRSRPISFAPMPSHMARFGAHVDAITSALNDARDNLEDCVDTLKAGHESVVDVQEHPALQAYERLRKELGIALRECERGREKLLDIVSPPSAAEANDDEGDGEDMDDLPSLGSSGHGHDQDQDQDNSSLEEMHQAPEHEPEVQVADEREEDVLPPPGIEQVYEGEPVTLPEWTRERSKMSREERIRAAREKREQQQHVDSAKEKWGPTGEVVQELKDVIWKVGEKRRRLAIVPPPHHQPLLPPPQSPLPPIPTEHVLESGPGQFGLAL